MCFYIENGDQLYQLLRSLHDLWFKFAQGDGWESEVETFFLTVMGLEYSAVLPTLCRLQECYFAAFNRGNDRLRHRIDLPM